MSTTDFYESEQLLRSARSALESAKRVYERHRAGAAPVTRWSYGQGRDNALLALNRYRSLGLPAESLHALDLYRALDTLAAGEK